MRILILSILAALVSCAAVPTGQKSNEFNRVSIGMSKAAVIASLGAPSRVSANESAEFLVYLLVDDVDYTQSLVALGMAPPYVSKSEYFVRLVNGTVDAYGRLGDFGTGGTASNAQQRRFSR